MIVFFPRCPNAQNRGIYLLNIPSVYIPSIRESLHFQSSPIVIEDFSDLKKTAKLFIQWYEKLFF